MVIPSQAPNSIGEGVETTLEIGQKEPVMKARNYTVSYKRSLIIGMLLGDASSQMKRTKNNQLRAEFAVCHNLRYEDLAHWKAMELSRLFDTQIDVKKYQNKARFSVTRGKRIRVISTWFYRNGKKTITDKIRFMNHPVGVSMLLCDAGSIRKRKKRHTDGTIYYSAPCIKIAMHAFSYDEIERFLIHKKESCYAEGSIKKRGVRQEVIFNAENSKKLWHYVSSWIPQVPSMTDKFSSIIEKYSVNQSDETAGT